DGDDVRAYSELLILEKVMQAIQRKKNLPSTPEPWRYFDLIGGTGVGGLIAILLRQYQLSIDQALQ
ncbi:hypothetical protein K469DRAFT_521292, partial [Zopfia rhizophila CBS 207.26]